MPKGNTVKQTSETDLVKLVELAKAEIASGKVSYISLEYGQQAEQSKHLQWIIAHCPHWRSAGSDEIIKHMRKLGLWADADSDAVKLRN